MQKRTKHYIAGNTLTVIDRQGDGHEITTSEIHPSNVSGLVLMGLYYYNGKRDIDETFTRAKSKNMIVKTAYTSIKVDTSSLESIQNVITRLQLLAAYGNQEKKSCNT